MFEFFKRKPTWLTKDDELLLKQARTLRTLFIPQTPVVNSLEALQIDECVRRAQNRRIADQNAELQNLYTQLRETRNERDQLYVVLRSQSDDTGARFIGLLQNFHKKPSKH